MLVAEAEGGWAPIGMGYLAWDALISVPVIGEDEEDYGGNQQRISLFVIRLL